LPFLLRFISPIYQAAKVQLFVNLRFDEFFAPLLF